MYISQVSRKLRIFICKTADHLLTYDNFTINHKTAIAARKHISVKQYVVENNLHCTTIL